jgi:uncharacterized protein YqjF (DUF2071 family)
MVSTVPRPFLTAEWRYLALFNFRVPRQLLAPYVPAGTVLDEWCGDTWLSVVGFRFLKTRLFGIGIPGHRHFPEINLRFYVRSAADGRRAVVFIREIVPRRAIATTARWLYNEPYVTRRMAMDAPVEPTEHPGRVSYRWHHKGRWNSIGVTAVGSPSVIQDGSAEQFIAEHERGYAAQRDGSTVEYQVDHPRWRTWPVIDVTFDVDAAVEYGVAFAEVLRDPPATTFLADGSRVRVSWPRRIASQR